MSTPKQHKDEDEDRITDPLWPAWVLRRTRLSSEAKLLYAQVVYAAARLQQSAGPGACVVLSVTAVAESLFSSEKEVLLWLEHLEKAGLVVPREEGSPVLGLVQNPWTYTSRIEIHK